MTFYLMDMLELLSTGQEGIIEDLELNLSKLERIKEFFKSDKWSERRQESNLLRIMTSLNVFVNDEADFSVTKLMEMSHNSRYKVNQMMSKLEEEGYVNLVSPRPKTYKVSDEFLESILGF